MRWNHLKIMIKKFCLDHIQKQLYLPLILNNNSCNNNSNNKIKLLNNNYNQFNSRFLHLKIFLKDKANIKTM